MRSNRNFWNIFIRVFLIVAFTIGMVYTYLETELPVTPYMFAGLLVITALEMTYRLNKQERTWTQFLNSIAYGDFNRSYHQTNSKALQEAYQLITQKMEGLQTDKAAEFRLLQTVLGHIGVAVICFQRSGKVLFTNKAFQTLFELEGIMEVEHMKSKDEAIYEILSSNEYSYPFWIDHKNGKKLLVKMEDLKLKGRSLRLVSFSDIKHVLERKEQSSYQKLLRVMTHEIMNSTTPILSLIRVINHKLIDSDRLKSLNEKDQKNTAKSLKVIEERTDGMLSFVSAYKKINQPIQLRKEPVLTTELIASVVQLTSIPKHINFTQKDSCKDYLSIDKALFTQVLINLTKNGIEALDDVDQGLVTLSIDSIESDIRIIISDNGTGVAEDKLESLFVPFFTTKLQGSGVGLAFSKKVIMAHGGSIEYERRKDQTHFIIKIPLNSV